jgi:hypothetical protein
MNMTTIEIHANGEKRCSRGCGRKATYAIRWQDCDGEYYGYCGYCYRGNCCKQKISDMITLIRKS